MKQTGTSRVDKIIDGQTILMKDNKIVRLLGIDYPQVTGEDVNATAVAAKGRLETLMPPETEVMLFQTRNQKAGRINRMGHVLAHLVVKKSGQWINGTLVDDGLAFVETDASNPDMATQLYAIEDKARQAKKGLWMDVSPYGLLTAETASKGDGAFRVVQGIVNRAAVSKNNLYLNFGSDWHKDFTVMISATIRRELSKKGIDPMGLSGKTLRVRGWLREWNGPYMELETPERLEIVTHKAPEEAAPDEERASPVSTENELNLQE